MLGFQLGIHLSGSLSVHKGKCNSLKTRMKTTQPLLFVGGFFSFFLCNSPLLEKNRCQDPEESFHVTDFVITLLLFCES